MNEQFCIYIWFNVPYIVRRITLMSSSPFFFNLPYFLVLLKLFLNFKIFIREDRLQLLSRTEVTFSLVRKYHKLKFNSLRNFAWKGQLKYIYCYFMSSVWDYNEQGHMGLLKPGLFFRILSCHRHHTYNLENASSQQYILLMVHKEGFGEVMKMSLNIPRSFKKSILCSLNY